MKPEIAKLWVDALRSGKFKQGQLSLEVDGKLCCLGVLCRLAQRRGVPLKVESVPGFPTAFDGERVITPPIVMEWSGLRKEAGDYNSDNCLSYDNDKGKTFAEIADIIEANVDAL